jgi:ElaB/YqjD/DUF883 family membrane-anchored ribosome-binding protein
VENDLPSNGAAPATDGRVDTQPASDQVAEQERHVAEQVQAGIDQVRSELDQLERRTRELIQARPITSLVTALAAGFLLGRIAKRLT